MRNIVVCTVSNHSYLLDIQVTKAFLSFYRLLICLWMDGANMRAGEVSFFHERIIFLPKTLNLELHISLTDTFLAFLKSVI